MKIKSVTRLLEDEYKMSQKPTEYDMIIFI